MIITSLYWVTEKHTSIRIKLPLRNVFFLSLLLYIYHLRRHISTLIMFLCAYYFFSCHLLSLNLPWIILADFNPPFDRPKHGGRRRHENPRGRLPPTRPRPSHGRPKRLLQWSVVGCSRDFLGCEACLYSVGLVEWEMRMVEIRIFTLGIGRRRQKNGVMFLWYRFWFVEKKTFVRVELELIEVHLCVRS